MRILFLCQYFPPEMGAPAARTYEHAREWVEMGHEVTVVCGLPNHPDGVVPPQYCGTFLYREKIDGINVLRCWLFTTPNRGVFKRSISFMTFMLSSFFFGTFFSGRADVVVATSPQILCALSGSFVALFKRRPFVLEVRDLWPKQIIDLGAVKNRAVIRALQWVEMHLYRRAKAVVTVAPATKEEIASRGVPREKLYSIPNGINQHFFTPRNRHTPIREKYGWGDDTVVMYIGTHGLSQGLETILEAARRLSDQRDIRFVFAGTGAEREKLIERAREMDLRNIEFLKMQIKDDMPNFYGAADICLVPLKKREVFLYNIPSKMFEIMACARPIVLGVEGQARELLEEAGAGIPVTPEDPAAFAEAIVRLADHPEERARFGASGRAHVLGHYTRAQLARNYITCLSGVLNAANPAPAPAVEDIEPRTSRTELRHRP